MIHLYATTDHLWALERFTKRWAPWLAPHVSPVSYDAISVNERLSPGVHVFADFERLLPTERLLAARLHRRIADHPESYRCLNDPSAWQGRFALLHELAEAGINDYRARRFRGAASKVRFPAFVRFENDHDGSLGPPAHSAKQLRNRVQRRVGARRRTLMGRHLMVVEMLDVRGDDGLYRKYSAMKIGERLIPRHVLFSRKWMTKKPDVVTPATAAEERAYLESFPDADQLEDVFRRAGLDYGRIDYGFHQGRLQVWEVNSNPVLVPPPRRVHRLRRPGQEWSAARIIDAFEELLAAPLPGEGIRAFGLPDRLLWRAHAPLSRRYDRHRR